PQTGPAPASFTVTRGWERAEGSSRLMEIRTWEAQQPIDESFLSDDCLWGKDVFYHSCAGWWLGFPKACFSLPRRFRFWPDRCCIATIIILAASRRWTPNYYQPRTARCG